MIAQLSPEYIKTRPFKVYNRLVSYLLFEGRPLTTRGRWINPFVFTLFSLEKKLPSLKKIKKPIYIIGTGRSGTTILGVILSMHKDVGFLNEPKALWHKIYPYEDLIGNYTRGKAFYRLNEKEVNEDIKRTAYRLYGWYLTLSFSKRIVDKYPELIFRIPFVKAIFPDAKFLFLVRNGKDACYSIKGWSERLGKVENGEIHDWWGINDRKWNLLVEQVVKFDEDLGDYVEEIRNFKDHLNRAAVEWILSMKEGLKLMDVYKGDILPIYYENLVESPKEILMKICDFCELEKDERFLNFGEEVLKPSKRKYKETIKLSPVIEPVFKETMNSLGYKI